MARREKAGQARGSSAGSASPPASRRSRRASTQATGTPRSSTTSGRSLRRAGNEVSLSAQQTNADVAPGSAGQAGATRVPLLDDRALVESFAGLRLKLQLWGDRDDVRVLVDQRAQDLSAMNKSSFWYNRDKAQATIERFNRYDRLLKRLRQLADRAEYLEDLAGLVKRQRDATYRGDLAQSCAQLARDVEFLEIELLTAKPGYGNDRALMLLRSMGTRTAERGPGAQVAQLATMYGRWAWRKGYEVRVATLEPLHVTPEKELAARERVLEIARAAKDETDLALASAADVVTAFVPYQWTSLAAPDSSALAKELATLPDPRELAILLAGSNVYGFLSGEQGLHRFNQKLECGGHEQGLVEVSVRPAMADDALLDELLRRGLRTVEFRSHLAPQVAEQLRPDEAATPDVVRVYQLTNPRHVRDPRTGVRDHDVKAVLEGDLDEFVLAYLRQASVSDGMGD